MRPMTEAKRVVIYGDGACVGNPGPGGYGVVLLYGGRRRELSGGFRLTTNNRMELMAVIVGFEALREPCDVELHSDSRYVIEAMRQRWLDAWRARGWKTSDKKPVANQDLWERLLRAIAPNEVKWHWVRGHAGDVENERCDELAEAAARGTKFEIDAGYEARGAGPAQG
jgi:ribonuclease HI